MGLIDRYELVRVLGRGGAGEVHLARDRLSGGREVALKTISARVDAVIHAAFEREFATLATLRVPGVAQVYDFGVQPARAGGAAQPFFTRAYIAGEPLDVASHKLDLQARVHLFLRAAAIIGPLHRVGVVHGDIKPGNIIVDAAQHAWLIDFGLARARGRATHEHTESGSVGTPSFMAPELLKHAAPSVAGDIYALGVTLFWLVSGEYPYAELGRRAWEARLAGDRVTLPNVPDARTRAVLEVAARALEPDPADRFPCIAEFQASLERLFELRDEGERPFVLPRPRGHEAPLAQVEAALAAEGGGSTSLLVHAARGGGKSLLLHELKWRRQLASQLVIEVFAGRSRGALPLISLIEQLVIALGAEHAASRDARSTLSQLERGQLSETAAADSLSALLQAVAEHVGLALFVDDLDLADATFGAVLRSALHARTEHPVAIVATACDVQAQAVRELQADRVFELPRLSAEESAELCAEALGPLDQAVSAALVQHAQGLPGALASAFYRLSSLSAVTPADVAQLPPAEATLALTQGRLARVPGAGRQLLEVLALVSSLPEPLALQLLAAKLPESERSQELQRLESEGFLARAGGQLVLADDALRKALSSTLGAAGQARLAAATLAESWSSQLNLPDRVALAVTANDSVSVRAHALPAAEALVAIGAQARAAQLLRALVACSEGELHERALLRLGGLQHALGEDASAAELAKRVVELASSSQRRADARLLEARALTALSRWDDAVNALADVSSDESIEPKQRAQVQRELAKIHLRRGDYAAVASAADAGLRFAPADDPVRVELLCSRGVVAGYAGDQAVARACYEEALSLARARGVRSDEANVLTYMAIGAQRAGDMLAARDLLAQSLEIARELGDVGNMARFSMNLGAVFYYLGEPAQAAEHYDSAARLSRRAGRTSTRVMARANLAHIHVYFGLYERARAEIDEVMAMAEAASQRATIAQLTAMRADLLSRTNDVERALIAYDDALARFAALGRTREVIEHNLDAAETLLNRGGPADASAAAGYVARAREHLAREPIEDMRLRLDLLVARARLASGDADGAALGCEDVVARARATRSRDIEWAALAALAIAQQQCGAMFAAKRSARAAVEVLEDIALRVPREHRDAFWQDPRRRAVREHANQSEHAAMQERPETRALALDQERERLFQIIRRLASEHDLPRLLERIIESAVDLSGAERGSVLLVDAQGHLIPQITHARPSLQDEAHELFSRSIAEAVLIDGEPIVTIDAVADGRLQSYVSVHKLMLRSVACLPIRAHTGTVGVLYLEHRRSRGRFSEAAVELLSAFADQAAIAIENARQLSEITRQKSALEEANRELATAKAALEDLLLTRTRQLEDVQLELARATKRTEGLTARHGIVGKSTGMQRIFDAIARLASNTVPVVICGETGTGKELVARAIHYSGPRAAAPFVTIDCGSLPESLLESELFGYVKGAFSGADRDRRGLIAAASGGTLFLDEVSEMPARMQASLLRVLQERKVWRLGSDVEEAVDVRLLTATRTPLAGLVKRGLFREDLLYRLSVVEVTVPPLRDRREDIPLLCDHLLRDLAQREGIPRCHLTRSALATLMEQPWPGNVRQLGHVLLQACVMTDGSTIDASDLSLGDSAGPRPPSAPPTAINPLMVENLNHHKLEEKQRILHALEASGWNRVKAAQALGMPRRTFYRRLADYSILGD